jgi:hypothetical protein
VCSRSVLFPARVVAGAVLACGWLSSSVASSSPVVAAVGLAVAASYRLAPVGRFGSLCPFEPAFLPPRRDLTPPGFKRPCLIRLASRKLCFNCPKSFLFMPTLNIHPLVCLPLFNFRSHRAILPRHLQIASADSPAILRLSMYCRANFAVHFASICAAPELR